MQRAGLLILQQQTTTTSLFSHYKYEYLDIFSLFRFAKEYVEFILFDYCRRDMNNYTIYNDSGAMRVFAILMIRYWGL